MKNSKKYHKINNTIKSEIFKHSKKLFNSDPNTSWGNCLKKSWQIAKSKPTFDNLFKTYYKYINNTIKCSVNFNETIAIEITQDTFIKANKYYDSFNPFTSNVKTWLITIAKSTIVDYYRAKTTRHDNNKISIDSFINDENKEYGEEYLLRFESNETSDTFENDNLKEKMDKAINNLKPILKQIFTLYYFENKKYREIAEMLDMPLGTVKANILRTKQTLKESLKEFAYMA